MNTFLAEMVGTALLILLGNGVVAGVVLKNSKAEGSGWIVITFGWALAVTFGVYAVGSVSGAHLNPAVTLGLAATGSFPWEQVPAYIVAQMLGASRQRVNQELTGCKRERFNFGSRGNGREGQKTDKRLQGDSWRCGLQCARYPCSITASMRSNLVGGSTAMSDGLSRAEYKRAHAISR